MKLACVAIFAILAMTAGSPLRAQTQGPFPIDTSRFAKRASEVTNVSLDKTMLQFAAKFLSSSGQDERAQNIINHLQGIYVRHYEFKESDDYSTAEVEALRRHFRGPEWNQIVTTRSKGEGDNTDVYMHTHHEQIDGMFIIAAQPRELTLVHIIGPLKPEDLASLSGHFGVPAVQGGKAEAKRKGNPQ